MMAKYNSEIKLTKDNIDIYFPINQKVELIQKCSKKYFSGDFLDLGCGRMPYRNIIEKDSSIKKYIGIDIKNENYQLDIKPDFYWDSNRIPLENNVIDSAMLIEVLEHIPNPINTLKELSRVIKKDGVLLITVPFLWTLHDVPYDEYRYTPFALKRMIEEEAFEILEMESFGSWHASMASMLALYVKRATSGRRKKILTFLLTPLIKKLYKKDETIDHSKFRESEMITGIWCVAKKK